MREMAAVTARRGSHELDFFPEAGTAAGSGFILNCLVVTPLHQHAPTMGYAAVYGDQLKTASEATYRGLSEPWVVTECQKNWRVHEGDGGTVGGPGVNTGLQLCGPERQVQKPLEKGVTEGRETARAL